MNKVSDYFISKFQISQSFHDCFYLFTRDTDSICAEKVKQDLRCAGCSGEVSTFDNIYNNVFSDIFDNIFTNIFDNIFDNIFIYLTIYL